MAKATKAPMRESTKGLLGHVLGASLAIFFGGPFGLFIFVFVALLVESFNVSE
jgi:fructose-specific phosphotransferase system IIC component